MSEELEKNVLSIIPQIVWNELKGEQKIKTRFGFSGSIEYYDVKNGLSAPYVQGKKGFEYNRKDKRAIGIPNAYEKSCVYHYF